MIIKLSLDLSKIGPRRNAWLMISPSSETATTNQRVDYKLYIFYTYFGHKWYSKFVAAHKIKYRQTSTGIKFQIRVLEMPCLSNTKYRRATSDVNNQCISSYQLL